MHTSREGRLAPPLRTQLPHAAVLRAEADLDLLRAAARALERVHAAVAWWSLRESVRVVLPCRVCSSAAAAPAACERVSPSLLRARVWSALLLRLLRLLRVSPSLLLLLLLLRRRLRAFLLRGGRAGPAERRKGGRRAAIALRAPRWRAVVCLG